MSEPLGFTTELEDWLDLMRRGNVEARNRVIDHACERLRKLTRKMLRKNPRLRRWEQTDDVLQGAMLRLHRSLAEVQPESVRQFFGLAAIQIRRELIDLARHHYGPEGAAAKHHTDDGQVLAERTSEPDTLDEWANFHLRVEKLPDEEREVFHLLFYKGLSQAEAAKVLGISLATIKRRWQTARLRLNEARHE